MIKLSKKNPDNISADLLVYFSAESAGKIPDLQSNEVKQALKQPWSAGDFSGRKDEFFLFYPPQVSGSRSPKIKARRVLVVGMGKLKEEKSEQREQVRIAAGTAIGQARKLKAKKVSVVLPDFTGLSPLEVAECVTEGLILGNYMFIKYKKNIPEEEQPVQVRAFIFHSGGLNERQARKGMKKGEIAARAASTARDMANEPGNGWTPTEFASFSRKLARSSGLKCTVLEKSNMMTLGMGGILGVNQGSAAPPKLVILEYLVGKKNPTLLLVGKGLTFDSGGISLKPSAGMEKMKYDMCGGAAVLAAMQGVSEEKPAHLNIVAIIPATDNMAGSAALKPGDIITHYNGKTSEVVNTDAEGRLILADALAYGVEKYKPDAVIDLATLTGAVIIGLGHHRTGLLSNNDEMAARIIEAGDQCGEPLWRLPLGPEYSKQLKSEVADLKNVGGRDAGTITAAAYLQEFIGETPWAHLDIAGTAWEFTEKSYSPAKGPSGVGVRTLLTLIHQWKPFEK
ncbi:MAG: leucyl aminopeptidase [Desulfobulbaceae bacterium]|nr:leucyl aminopeptidase [Desulfobulbaceae bacterium]